MTTEIFRSNTPENFWQCNPNPSNDEWEEVSRRASPVLKLENGETDIEAILTLTLGEGQFGPRNWELNSQKKLYYMFKKFLPAQIKSALKRINRLAMNDFPLQWPIEGRYVDFQWEVMRQLLIMKSLDQISFRPFWPSGKSFAFVLTHDVESEVGLENVRALADLDERLGFRSAFNFAPERYDAGEGLIQELLDRGFEVGLHGLKHDGKLFLSQGEFLARAKDMNSYLRSMGAAGFRAPLMHRNPIWMQELDIEYDLSFFDTDPFEPMPGGCMSIWPYTIGKFLELPYTLAQDSTLLNLLGERTPRFWLEKLDFIEKYCGMALVIVHPDYVFDDAAIEMYRQLLENVRNRDNYWNALPREVAAWWRKRNNTSVEEYNVDLGLIKLAGDQILIQ